MGTVITIFFLIIGVLALIFIVKMIKKQQI